MDKDSKKTDYSKCAITDVRIGKGSRSDTLYALLRDAEGGLVISATLEYIVAALNERIPSPEES